MGAQPLAECRQQQVAKLNRKTLIWSNGFRRVRARRVRLEASVVCIFELTFEQIEIGDVVMCN